MRSDSEHLEQDKDKEMEAIKSAQAKQTPSIPHTSKGCQRLVRPDQCCVELGKEVEAAKA